MYTINGEMRVYFGKITTICVMIMLLFSACKCWKLPDLPKNVTPLVIGGQPAAPGELPYQIAFKRKSEKNANIFYTFCGGSIIGEAKILSAAHCFVDEEYTICSGHQTHAKGITGIYAVAGSVRNVVYFRNGTNDEEVSQWRRLKNVVYPQDYTYPHNDIAILFVVTPFKYDHFVKPIRMADQFEDYKGFSLVSGYGEVGYTIKSDSLLKAFLYTFPHKDCTVYYPNLFMGRSICTSIEKTDIGRGDSGGPLVYSHNYEDKNSTILIGIACGTYVGRHSIFVRVSAYQDFIRTAKNHGKEDTSFYYFIVIPPLLGKDHPSEIVNNISNVKYPEYKKWIARIMNGWEGKLGDVPYQIALKGLVHRRKGLYKTFCGATIISPRKLISAAHCFEEGFSCHKFFYPGKVSKSALQNNYAVAGNLNNIEKYSADGPNGQWRTLESATYPKKYKFPKQDIAVLITVDPFVFTKYIKPIPIASRKKDYSGKCLASGFGRTGHKSQDQTEVLLLAYLVVFPTNVCNKMHRMQMKHYICTSSKFTDVGKGDSGGPLVCANTGDPNEKNNETGILVGVVSGHFYNVGSFFSRVSRYKHFIANVNSVSMIMYTYNMQSCTVVAMSVLYKTFVLF